MAFTNSSFLIHATTVIQQKGNPSRCPGDTSILIFFGYPRTKKQQLTIITLYHPEVSKEHQKHTKHPPSPGRTFSVLANLVVTVTFTQMTTEPQHGSTRILFTNDVEKRQKASARIFGGLGTLSLKQLYKNLPLICTVGEGGIPRLPIHVVVVGRDTLLLSLKAKNYLGKIFTYSEVATPNKTAES